MFSQEEQQTQGRGGLWLLRIICEGSAHIHRDKSKASWKGQATDRTLRSPGCPRKGSTVGSSLGTGVCADSWSQNLPGAGGNFMSEPGPGIASLTGVDPAKGLEEKEAQRKTLPWRSREIILFV